MIVILVIVTRVTILTTRYDNDSKIKYSYNTCNVTMIIKLNLASYISNK